MLSCFNEYNPIIQPQKKQDFNKKVLFYKIEIVSKLPLLAKEEHGVVFTVDFFTLPRLPFVRGGGL